MVTLVESTDRFAASDDVAVFAAGDVLASNVVVGFSLAATLERAVAAVVLGADLAREAADAVVVVGLAVARAVAVLAVVGLITVLKRNEKESEVAQSAQSVKWAH